MIRWIPNPDQVNLQRGIGWIRLADELCKVISNKSPVAVFKTICERCTEEHNRLCKGLNKYSCIKIFSIIFCTLVTFYTCKIVKDAFKIVLFVTTFYVQHCCSIVSSAANITSKQTETILQLTHWSYLTLQHDNTIHYVASFLEVAFNTIKFEMAMVRIAPNSLQNWLSGFLYPGLYHCKP